MTTSSLSSTQIRGQKLFKACRAKVLRLLGIAPTVAELQTHPHASSTSPGPIRSIGGHQLVALLWSLQVRTSACTAQPPTPRYPSAAHASQVSPGPEKVYFFDAVLPDSGGQAGAGTMFVDKPGTMSVRIAGQHCAARHALVRFQRGRRHCSSCGLFHFGMPVHAWNLQQAPLLSPSSTLR